MSTNKKQVDSLLPNVHSFHGQKPAKSVSSFSGLFCIAPLIKLSQAFFNFFNKQLMLVNWSAKSAFPLLLVMAFSFLSMSNLSAQDADSDGVLDGVDWCPTEGGTVNALGCPFPVVCDTIATATIAFDTSGLNPSSGYKTIYILADSVGLIVDTSSAPQFVNVTEGKYMVIAMDYIDDGSLANFAVADTINETTANCLEWSSALTYRICPAEICNDGIDNDEDGDTDCLDSDCPNPVADATSSGPHCVGDQCGDLFCNRYWTKWLYHRLNC